jgi:hypothetical protein
VTTSQQESFEAPGATVDAARRVESIQVEMNVHASLLIAPAGEAQDLVP